MKEGVVVLVNVPLVWNLVVEKDGRKLRRGFVFETAGKEVGLLGAPRREKFCVIRLLREKVGCSATGTGEPPDAFGTSEKLKVRFVTLGENCFFK
jgi:hypothetical protein